MDNKVMHILLGLAACSLASCASRLAPADFSGGAPELRPEAFFAGITRSSGIVESSSGAPKRRMHAEGHGVILSDGSIQLEQNVTQGDGGPKKRTWVMRREGAHRYTATLTDASGPVEGEAYGDLFHLFYALKTPGAQMEQWMYLQPDGRTVMNVGTVSVFGVVVERISERITREGP